MFAEFGSMFGSSGYKSGEFGSMSASSGSMFEELGSKSGEFGSKCGAPGAGAGVSAALIYIRYRGAEGQRWDAVRLPRL
jgi:hypothetical protein